MENKDIKIENHALCFALALQYMTGIIEAELPELKNKDYTEQLKKYQPNRAMGETFSGRTWVTWFLKDYMPQYLKEEEDGKR